MRLHVDLNTDGELLLAVVTGAMSFDAVWQVLNEICDTALQKHLTLILVDALAAQEVLKTIDRYTIGVQLVDYCGRQKFWPRLAFVGRPPVVDGFGVLVAKNRGLDTETFPNCKEALGWVRAVPKCVA
jgi:hypothetical protein